MSPTLKFHCPAPACRKFCGLIHADGKLPAPPPCDVPDCPAVNALHPLKARLETSVATILAAHAASRNADRDVLRMEFKGLFLWRWASAVS